MAGELRFGCQYAERNFVPPRSSSSERPIFRQEMASVKQRVLMACAVLWFGCGLTMAQENGHIPVSVVEDWSTRHMIFAEDVARENRGAVLAEPRFWQQYLRRHASRRLPAFDEDRGARARTRPGSRWRPGSSPELRQSPPKTQEGAQPSRLECVSRRRQRGKNLRPLRRILLFSQRNYGGTTTAGLTESSM